MLPTVSLYQNAQKCAQVMSHILVEEMNLEYPHRFLMTEHGQFTWLLVVMDDLNLGGSMNKYVHESTLHRLSTALDGLPVVLSNHSGLRYAVLLSEKPRLPQSVEYPTSTTEAGVIPLGVGLGGPIHAHAKQIVNMIIVGAQDSGKSMVLRSLAHTARLQGAALYLADPVQHTFNPDVWGRTAMIEYSTAGFLRMLELLNAEITKRSALFRSAGDIPPEDLDAYNAATGESMPRVWLIADEANSFLANKATQERLAEPARIGRKFGIHIVLAGHDWHEYTVNRGLTGYFETRLCLRTSNDTAGRIVLDDSTRGRRTMSFRQPGRAVLRLRGQYQDVQLYKVTPEREREWFTQMLSSDDRMQWVAAQVETTPVIFPATKKQVDIKQLAESIRSQWNPGLSKRAVGRLLKQTYAGSWVDTIDEIISYLRATTTSESTHSA